MDKLKLLANLPLYVDNIPIYSPILRDVAAKGLKQYRMILTYGTITIDSINDNTSLKDNYDALLKLFTDCNDSLSMYLYSINFLTKVDFIPIIEHGEIIFIKDNIKLHRDNYDLFVKNVKFANRLEVNSDEVLDDFDRQVKEMEKKIQEAQSKNVQQPDFEDLISAVANFDGNGLNIINIWDLNIYQFYEQFQRGQLKEQYKWNLQQLLAGAKPDDIKLESYIKKLDN